MNRRNVIHILVALGLIVTTNVTVLADPLADAIKEKKAQEQLLRKENSALEKSDDNIEQLEHDIQMLDYRIEGSMLKLESNEKEIAKAETNIEAAAVQVDEAQQNIEEKKELYDKRMRAMYKSRGSIGYLEMLLKSESFTDLLSRVEAINKIAQFDKKIIGQFETAKQVLEEKKTNLEGEKLKLEVIKADNESQLAQMKKDKASQTVLIAKAKAERKNQESKIKEIRDQIELAERNILALRDAAPKYVPSRGAAPVSNNSLVIYASNFLGTPYRWGGTTPSGFDCSGFMKYVFAHFGIRLPRTSDSQFGVGQSISRDNLEAGDLVFFGSPGNPHHVGMYVGNNCYIHSPQTGDVVKVSAMTRRDFIGGRRVR
jgi:peptidoglycan DL-endopeptidase CwlO